MDYLWTPWRYQYMEQVSPASSPNASFAMPSPATKMTKRSIVYRGKKAFIILNRFPYTSGHVMIVPYAHVAELNLCDPEARSMK